MTGDYRLTGLAVPESLELLHELLDRVRDEHPEIDAGDLMMFETAIVEIHGNVVKHGRPEGRVEYDFSLDVAPARLEGTLATHGDDAPDFSGLAPSEPTDPLAESGRGIWLAETVLDELAYSRDGDGNVWHMVKNTA